MARGLAGRVGRGVGSVGTEVRAGKQEYARLRAAVDEHCPVLDLFANPVPTSGELI